jgi:hypothetical protein
VVTKLQRPSARRFLSQLKSVSGEDVIKVFSDLVRFSAVLDGLQRPGW